MTTSRFSPVSFRLGSLLFALFVAIAAGLPSAALGQGAPAEDETLVGDVTSSGGYGAPTVALTSVNGEVATLTGAQGGWVLNRRFVLGGAIRGIAPRPDASLQGAGPDAPESAQLQLGYLGLLVEHIGRPSSLVHYGGELVVGGGVTELVDSQGFRAGASVTDDSYDRSGVFAAELGARAEVNVTRFFRIGLSGGYRFVSGSDMAAADISSADLSAPYGQLSLRFGSF
jgi:hypothetical protein